MTPTNRDQLLWYSRFAMVATYGSTALSGVTLVVTGNNSIARLICGWLIGSGLAMWCIVDSMRKRTVFPYGQWWLCLTPAAPLVVLDYVSKTRGRAGLLKAAGHGAALVVINVAFAVLYFLAVE